MTASAFTPLNTPAVRKSQRAMALGKRVKDWSQRPELGAAAGLCVVLIIFMFTADPRLFTLAGMMSVLEPAAQLGILAIMAGLLMIAGEFDLSIGAMIAFGGMAMSIPIVLWGWPLELALLVAFGCACVVGVTNATITVRSGLPSFIVTLAFLFILRGMTLIGLKWATGGASQLRGIQAALPADSLLVQMLSGEAFQGGFSLLARWGLIDTFKSGAPKVSGVPVEILWFFGLTMIATILLLKTPFGNWIFATGGNAESARRVGVPVTRVKIILFCGTACAATLVGTMNALDFGSIDASRGMLKEFEAIIAAVIGGCLLTGGYGSVIGTFFGAIIFGLVSIGISYTNINQDWFKVFLGVMLLVSVLINQSVRKRLGGE
jgi:simple sugar transport system permease protein